MRAGEAAAISGPGAAGGLFLTARAERYICANITLPQPALRTRSETTLTIRTEPKGPRSDMSCSRHITLACLAAALVTSPAALASYTFTYQITTDTYLDSLNPASNYGLSGSDKVVINSSSRCRTLFDLPAGLWLHGPGSIRSASVSFYVWSDSTAAYDVSLFPLTTAFVEGNGTDGATWLTCDGTRAWNTAGGDFNAAHSVVGAKGPLGVNPNDGNGRFFTFDIAPLLADPAVAAELRNFGAMLRIDETIPPSGQRFASFTSANSSTYSAPYLPSLELTVVPEPSGAILGALGLAAVACFRRQRSAAKPQPAEGGHFWPPHQGRGIGTQGCLRAHVSGGNL